MRTSTLHRSGRHLGRPPRRTIALAAVVAVAVVLAGCSKGSSDAGPATPSSVVQKPPTTPADGTSTPAKILGRSAISLKEPTAMVVRPGDPDLWVAERAGTVHRLAVSDGGRTLKTDGGAVLDISSDTTVDAERGLLGLAFSPDGDTLFVSHTDHDGNTRLASYAVKGDTVDASSRKVLLAVDQPYPNHNGGNVVWGPDQKLWFGLGDGGAADDPGNRAQNPKVLLGKVLRLDPTGGTPRIAITGVRNPWRFSFDTDGSLWIGDVGQNHIEEIDHLPEGHITGTNLGWSGYEGTQPYLDGAGRRPGDPVMPVFEYTHDDGNCSITGGFVYRGKALKGLDGAYLFADYCAGTVRAIRLDGKGKLAAEYDLGVPVSGPVSFTADANGEPYVLSDAGDVVRLVPAT